MTEWDFVGAPYYLYHHPAVVRVQIKKHRVRPLFMQLSVIAGKIPGAI